MHRNFELALDGDDSEAVVEATKYYSATGDNALLMTLKHRDSGSRALKRHLAAYSRAVGAYHDGSLDTAERLLRELPPASLDGRTSAWHAYHSGVIAHWRGDALRSQRLLDTASERCEALDRYLCLRTSWMKGLLHAVQARMGLAAREYRAALDVALMIGDREDALALTSLLAETDDYLGLTESAWSRRREVLTELQSIRDDQRRQTVLLTAAEALLQVDLADGASAFAEEADFEARAADDPALRVQSALYRARASRWSPDVTDAYLDDARRSLDMIGDSVVRDRLGGELLLAAAEREGVDSASALRKAHAYFLTRTHDTRLAQVLALEARASADRGDSASALDRAEESMRLLLRTEGAPALARTSALGRASEGLSSASARIFTHSVSPRIVERAILLCDFPRHFAVFGSRRPPLSSLQHLQASLPSSTTLVAYLLRSDALFRITITARHHSVDRVSLDLDRFFRQLSDTRDDLRHRRDAATSLRVLSDLLLTPELKGSGAAGKDLIFVLDPSMPPIPLVALVTAQGALLDTARTVAISPSLGSLTNGIWNGPMHGGLSLLEAASGSRGMSQEVTELTRAWRSKGVRRFSSSPEGLANALRSGRVVHIASHGIADGRAGFERLLLADDREVTTTDLWNLPSSAPLIVLAACSTAVGGHRGRTIQTSVANAMLASGAEAAIATLWDVQDDDGLSSALVHLHRRLTDGDSPLVALRQTQLLMRAREHPDWAALVAYVGGRPSH